MDETLDDLQEDFSARFSLGGMRGDVVLKYFKACDTEVSWMRGLDTDGQVWGMVIKPQSVALVETFGLLREVPVICTRYPEFQPRLLGNLDLISNALVKNRLQDDICIVLCDDELLPERLAAHEKGGMVWLPLSTRDISNHLASGAPSLRFRELVQKYLYARDFFDRADPVVGADYFGRTKLLQDLANQLARGAHVGMYGLRKVGKTSLIKRLIAKSKDSTVQGLRCVHVDLLATPPNSRNQTFLLHAIAESLVREGIVTEAEQRKMAVLSRAKLPKAYQLTSTAEIASFQARLDADLRALLASFVAKSERLVIVLDEIEQLFPIAEAKGYAGYNDFLSYLRGMSQQVGALSMLVVGVNPNVSEAQLLGTTPNPVFGFFSTRYVAPLSLEETKEMLKGLGRKSGVDFSPPAIEQLFTWLGGHPFLTRRYGSLLLEGRDRPLKVDLDLLEQTRETFMRRENPHFAEMVSVVRQYYPQEFDVLHRIACADGGLSEAAIGRQTLTHLEGYQLVSVVNGNAVLRNQLVREWLEGISRAAVSLAAPRQMVSAMIAVDSDAHEALLAALTRVELNLRRCIRYVLDRRWAGKADGRIKVAIGQTGFEEASARRDKSLRGVGANASATEILDYLYLGDLKRIIVGNEWQEFRGYFPSKQSIENSIDALTFVRNELAHARGVPQKEAVRAQLAADDISDWLNSVPRS